MIFQHVYDKTLAQSSYLIGCAETGEAIVIDPKRDVDTYLEIASQYQLSITYITETHIHADFLSGSRELSQITGATLYLSDEGGDDWQYQFDHTGLRNGDHIHVGNLRFQVIHTPGHTPESISFLLFDPNVSEEPIMLFTGDFIFVGDVGRPDLLKKVAGIQGSDQEGAVQLFHSLQEISQLSDAVQIWPGHGAGSACGKAISAEPSSTLGFEKNQNWAFQHFDDEQQFVSNLLEGQTEPPTYFATMKRLNKEDRRLLVDLPVWPKLSKQEMLDALRQDVLIIDTRSKKIFAENHLTGSINIQGNNSFATWMGWLVSYDTPFILIASEENIEDLSRKLMRIGMDQCIGYYSDIKDLGMDLCQSPSIDFEHLISVLQHENVTLVDVRSANEFAKGHIKNADSVFVGTLPEHLSGIPKQGKVIVYCQSGDRSAIAQSLLQRQGYKNILNYTGGIEDWKNKDGEVVASKI